MAYLPNLAAMPRPSGVFRIPGELFGVSLGGYPGLQCHDSGHHPFGGVAAQKRNGRVRKPALETERPKSPEAGFAATVAAALFVQRAEYAR